MKLIGLEGKNSANMKKDHLSPELRIKVKYLRELGCEIVNDRPGGYLVIGCPTWPEQGPGSQGRLFLESDIDAAILEAERNNPEIAKAHNKQLSLF